VEFAVAGKRVFAATGGRAFTPGPRALAFVHGAGLDHTVWMLPARYFANHGFAVAAVDLPGHGRSEGPALATVEAQGAWLLAAMDALGLARAALCGHSMGSLVALAAAGGAPARVAALALLATAHPMAVSDDLMTAAAANDHRAIDLIVGWGHGRQAHLGGSTAPGMWVPGGSRRLLERAAPGVLHTDLAAVKTYAGGLAAAARVACPTLVLLGDSDRMTPAARGRAVADAIAGAATVVLKDCGHMMVAEQPDQVTAALARHFIGALDAK
jgi:pimeloyl-ACP methyl ester carboxylesterase